MTKTELRRLFLPKRIALAAEERDALSLAIFKKFFEIEELFSKKCFHVFLPILRQNEVNTWPLIRLLWQHGKKIVVPVSDFQNNALINYFLDENTPLRESKHGIPEPHDTELADNGLIEVVLLPLLAFDQQGYRVGYGKGFYDKFIGGLNRDVVKIGLSFFEAVEVIEDIGEWDISLDYCVTPERVYSFQSNF